MAEHAGIATIRQRSRRQSGGLGETGAIAEHAIIATIRQRSRRQSGGLGEIGAMAEHAGIATNRHRGMRSRFNGCVVQKILNIANTLNVRTSENPSEVLAISSNHCIPSTPQIQDILITARSRR